MNSHLSSNNRLLCPTKADPRVGGDVLVWKISEVLQ